jgi:uncharacterized SAM-binding protein YcdF (DUF218 family)
MAILIKFIALPLYPLGLVITLQIAAIFFLVVKKRNAASILFCGAFFLLYIFSSPIVAQLLGKTLESRTSQHLPPKGVKATIVVLGGGGMPLSAPRKYPEINEAGDRILHGARLYKMGAARKVITTGGDVGLAFYKSISEAEENAMLLREIGVDSSAIIMELKARNTHEHPFYIAKILDSLNLGRNIILVTSATHMARSVAAFNKFGGYTIYSAPADFNTSEKVIDRITDFFPTSRALDRTTTVFHEYYGILGYLLLGWI